MSVCAIRHKRKISMIGALCSSDTVIEKQHVQMFQQQQQQKQRQAITFSSAWNFFCTVGFFPLWFPSCIRCSVSCFNILMVDIVVHMGNIDIWRDSTNNQKTTREKKIATSSVHVQHNKTYFISEQSKKIKASAAGHKIKIICDDLSEAFEMNIKTNERTNEATNNTKLKSEKSIRSFACLLRCQSYGIFSTFECINKKQRNEKTPNLPSDWSIFNWFVFFFVQHDQFVSIAEYGARAHVSCQLSQFN